MEGHSDKFDSLEEPIPEVKWAQRPNLIFLTICLEDCKNPKIDLLPKSLKFHGFSGPKNKQYKLNVEFFKEIVPEKCKFAIRDREIDLKHECAAFQNRHTNQLHLKSYSKIIVARSKKDIV